jgi:hypothetical protein
LLYELIADGIRRDMHYWGEPGEARRSLAAMERAYREGPGGAPIAAADVNATLLAYQNEAMQLGACLMYQLMGGAR